jgi:glutamate-ammonia-ligase adenylyltransferase
MKQRTEEWLQEKGRSWGEVKLGEGSIRDIEFVVQYLQMTHPAIRTRATMKAIPRLREEGFLTSSEAHILMDGYNFLRTTEHYLQLIDYRQASTLPSDPLSIALLARRLGFEGLQAGEQFIERYERHCRAVRSIFLKFVGNETIKELANLAGSSPQILQHVARMDASYTATFSPEEIQQHSLLIDKIKGDLTVLVDAKPLDDTRWRVTVVGYDYLGELSLICGLLFVYGLDIIESQIFTYEPLEGNKPLTNESSISKPSKTNGIKPTSIVKANHGKSLMRAGRPKIVDVFIVRSVHNDSLKPEIWLQYSEDLKALLLKMHIGQRREARGELAKKVGVLFQSMKSSISPLYPIDIEIDNDSSEKYTVLRIGSTDTVGFLYELSNALSMNHVNIARMFVESIGTHVNDTIYVTDNQGNKIITSEKQRELRAATVLIKHFTHLLPQSPNPESALLHFREFLGQLFERPNWPKELAQLDQPVVLEALAKLLGVSDFLWDDFLRMQYSNLFPVVRDIDALAANKDRRQLEDELESAVCSSKDWRTALNAFKDREMFRIDMRHILGYTTEFWEFSFGLTDLVEAVVSAAFNHCGEEIQQEYGVPILEDGHPCPATIFALGKCGGRELGFASDIELLLIYGGNGSTTGKKIISTSDYFEELVRSFTKSIQSRKDGIFNIDLRLRPYGKAGSLAVSLEAFKRYFEPKGPAWEYERQALVKLRPIAGDQVLGGDVCEMRDEFVYNEQSFNITAMRAMRERQIRHLVTAGIINAKYSPGGLVDLEYTVQALQIIHGATHPSLRSTNTRLAMAVLVETGILSADDYTRLRKAHTFLRWLIDALRVVRGNAKDINIPAYDSEEFAFLARRLRYGRDINQLKEDLSRYMMDVTEINQRLLPNP